MVEARNEGEEAVFVFPKDGRCRPRCRGVCNDMVPYPLARLRGLVRGVTEDGQGDLALWPPLLQDGFSSNNTIRRELADGGY